MHRISALLLVVATAVSAFAPQPAQHKSLHTPLRATKLAAVPNVPNPFQQLPWNVERAQKSKERKIKLERSRLHRELGIAEDATYEEINEATEKMIALSEGDLKRKIQIEVVKDKILQIRLNERLAGLTSDIVTKDAKAQSGFEADGYVPTTRIGNWTAAFCRRFLTFMQTGNFGMPGSRVFRLPYSIFFLSMESH